MQLMRKGVINIDSFQADVFLDVHIHVFLDVHIHVFLSVATGYVHICKGQGKTEYMD